MKDFLWRCLAALVAFRVLAVTVTGEDAAWSATFPGGGGDFESVAFAVGDGRHLVAITLPGMDADKGQLKLAGRVMPAEAFVDPVSRVVIFRISGPPGRALPLLAAAPSANGAALRHGRDGSGKISGVVKRIEDKILPLCLLKVEYGGAAPPPGTPLTDRAGAVLAVAHQTTGPSGGYALPVEVVKQVLEGVREGGRVTRGWIGMKLLPSANAPRVNGVQAGSPSARAGVLSGDLLLQVGSRRVDDYADVVNAFYFLRPGTPTPLRIRRGKEEITISVTPVERSVN